MLDLSTIRQAVRYEGGVSRRLFLAYGAALSAIPILGAQASGHVRRRLRSDSDPFALGVASGDPTHAGFVIWSRLAPEPLEGGGMPPEIVEARWEVAEDDAMKRIVRSGTALATPQLAHSLHIEVDGLKPDRWYWYRFQTGDATSPVGRARTMPEPAMLPEKLRFAFASCQHFEQGLFTGYQHMAQEELDLVVHLGDYIYEGAAVNDRVRKHVGGKLTTLADYRNRHAQYRGQCLPGVLRNAAAAGHLDPARTRHETVSDDFVRPAGDVSGARHAPVPHRPAERRQVVGPQRCGAQP
jgi:alkaline phosphatase D